MFGFQSITIQTFFIRYFSARSAFIYLLAATLIFITNNNALSEEANVDLLNQNTLTDFKGSPKDKLKKYGIDTEVWVTQIYQGLTAGDEAGVSRYGGKTDGFLKITPEKLGLLPGFRLDAQYEHYIGDNINNLDEALIAVNTAQAYLYPKGYHSALSLTATQRIDDHFTISVGKFNLMTLASSTPLIGGGGINTFMNRAFALPTTGVSYTQATGGAGDRVILSAPYLLGGIAEFNQGPFKVDISLSDPRSAQSPRVIDYPFEKGIQIASGLTVKTNLLGLNGSHIVRGAYSNASGINLDDIDTFSGGSIKTISAPTTKTGYWFASYFFEQNLFQSKKDPSKGFGLFGLGTLSDGNPTPIKWSMLVGLAGYNPLLSRENDRWGVGFFHFGLSQQLISGLVEIGDPRHSEEGVEAFYNIEITKWNYLSLDLQFIDPWNPSKKNEVVGAVRMQTKF
jgi:porin